MRSANSLLTFPSHRNILQYSVVVQLYDYVWFAQPERASIEPNPARYPIQNQGA